MSHLWCRFRFAVETIVDINKKKYVKLINSSMKKNKSGIVLDKHNASVLAIEWTVDFRVLAHEYVTRPQPSYSAFLSTSYTNPLAVMNFHGAIV